MFIISKCCRGLVREYTYWSSYWSPVLLETMKPTVLVVGSLTLTACVLSQPLTAEGCNFTADCQTSPFCQDLQVVGRMEGGRGSPSNIIYRQESSSYCLCNLETCVVAGGSPHHHHQCQTFRDCDCREDPDWCFCPDGFCRSWEAWECHHDLDCLSRNKCRDRHCSCQSKSQYERYNSNS